jgi:exonuclease III
MQLLLDSWPEKPAILCFSEHWLPSDHLIHINIDQYKLANKYCRNSDKHGGSCMFVLNEFKLRELPNITNLGKDKVFEISAIELVDLKIIVVSIYRSPMSSAETFLELLEATINKISKKGCFLILCGDWNINLLTDMSDQNV